MNCTVAHSWKTNDLWNSFFFLKDLCNRVLFWKMTFENNFVNIIFMIYQFGQISLPYKLISQEFIWAGRQWTGLCESLMMRRDSCQPMVKGMLFKACWHLLYSPVQKGLWVLLRFQWTHTLQHIESPSLLYHHCTTQKHNLQLWIIFVYTEKQKQKGTIEISFRQD